MGLASAISIGAQSDDEQYRQRLHIPAASTGTEVVPFHWQPTPPDERPITSTLSQPVSQLPSNLPTSGEYPVDMDYGLPLSQPVAQLPPNPPASGGYQAMYAALPLSPPVIQLPPNPPGSSEYQAMDTELSQSPPVTQLPPNPPAKGEPPATSTRMDIGRPPSPPATQPQLNVSASSVRCKLDQDTDVSSASQRIVFSLIPSTDGSTPSIKLPCCRDNHGTLTSSLFIL